MSKLVDYAGAVLIKMVAKADADSIWTGRLTELVGEVCPVGMYSRVVSILRSSGAVEQVGRGGGTSPSRWRILDANADLTTGDPSPSLLRKRHDLEDRVANLEHLVGNIDVPKAIADLTKEVRGEA